METKRNIKKTVYEELECTGFPICRTRTNVAGNNPVLAFSLGTVNYRGQKSVGGRIKGPSRFNKKYPVLLSKLRKMMKLWHPEFKYTTIQVNKNFSSKPHIDKNNVGPSYGIAMGKFTGGDLYVEGKKHNIKNKFLNFDGTLGHWVSPYKGTRYSLIFFTHTFKPPNAKTRYIKVTKYGLWDRDSTTKKNKLIKKYTSNGCIEYEYTDSEYESESESESEYDSEYNSECECSLCR